ncbi:hypothetical protein NL487_25970, partial [Klebsiella pneumoniae]|nr:hypothetical protein [Klebsiella pneumoniae]
TVIAAQVENPGVGRYQRGNYAGTKYHSAVSFVHRWPVWPQEDAIVAKLTGLMPNSRSTDSG